MKKSIWLVVAALVAYIYYPTFAWMVDRWLARDSYFAHGFLIPLVSLFWIYRKRRELASCGKQSDSAGVAIMLFGAVLQVASSILRIYFLSAYSFVIVLFGMIYFLFGRPVLRLVWFPVLFLSLMIPLPLLVISQVTIQMKFFVSEISTFFLNTSGIESVRQGSYIYTPHSVVLVGDPCSGLRSFIAFLCLGLVFAYESKIEDWKKAVLVFAGLPLALISNVVRVFAMGLLAEIYGMDLIATKVVHDGGGVLAFLVALICFIAIRQILEGSRRVQA